MEILDNTHHRPQGRLRKPHERTKQPLPFGEVVAKAVVEIQPTKPVTRVDVKTNASLDPSAGLDLLFRNIRKRTDSDALKTVYSRIPDLSQLVAQELLPNPQSPQSQPIAKEWPPGQDLLAFIGSWTEESQLPSANQGLESTVVTSPPPTSTVKASEKYAWKAVKPTTTDDGLREKRTATLLQTSNLEESEFLSYGIRAGTRSINQSRPHERVAGRGNSALLGIPVRATISRDATCNRKDNEGEMLVKALRCRIFEGRARKSLAT